MAVNQRDDRAGSRNAQILFRRNQKMPAGLWGRVNAGSVLAAVRCQDNQTATFLWMTRPGVSEDSL